MNIYEVVTQTIVDKLQQGVIPWRKSWNTHTSPRNALSLRPYTGINILLLLMQGFESPYWLTWHQVQRLGGRIQQGQKHTKIVYVGNTLKEVENPDGDIEEAMISFLRYYQVWNSSQVDFPDSFQLQAVPTAPAFAPLDACTTIIDRFACKPTIIHGAAIPAYSRTMDQIRLPYPNHFVSTTEYYMTLFHELVHSTGHHSRLNRHEVYGFSRFGDELYCCEELTAEIGAAFLCAHAGIVQPVLTNAAAYIQNWLQFLQHDPKAIVLAAGKAQRAVEYILGFQHAVQPVALVAEPSFTY